MIQQTIAFVALANLRYINALNNNHNNNNPRFEPLQVSSDDVVRALRSFPFGSAGGPDGLSPQHIANLVAGATDDSLQPVSYTHLTLPTIYSV